MITRVSIDQSVKRLFGSVGVLKKSRRSPTEAKSLFTDQSIGQHCGVCLYDKSSQLQLQS